VETQTPPFWHNDYEGALERAKDERKFVLLDIFNPG